MGICLLSSGRSFGMAKPQADSLGYIQLSERMLELLKYKESVRDEMQLLEVADPEKLRAELNTDEKRETFWINVYNALVQYLLDENPGLYAHKRAFFKQKHFLIAGKRVSLNEIEYDLLRTHGRKIIPSGFEKQFRISRKDYRVHLVLNNGAGNAPPIGIYTPADLIFQMDNTITAFLQQASIIRKQDNLLILPAIVKKYRKDFGNRKNLYRMLIYYGLLEKNEKPLIRYKSYDATVWERKFS
jgi:hypothetical protein